MSTQIEYMGYFAEIAPAPEKGKGVVRGRLLYVTDQVTFEVAEPAAPACFAEVVEDYLGTYRRLGRMPAFVCPACQQHTEDLLTHAFAQALCGNPVCTGCYEQACRPENRVGLC